MGDQKSELGNNQAHEVVRNGTQEATHNELPVPNVDTVEQTKPDPEIAGTSSLAHPTNAPLLGHMQSVTPSQVQPAQDGMMLVYALGTLDFDFGTEARRDSIMQHMGEDSQDPNQLMSYLEENPWECSAILWTLNLDATPIYAIRPQGPYASHGYERLMQFMREQDAEGVERVSISGIIATGQVRLLSGQVVPVISPELRGMYSWSTSALVQSISGKPPSGSATDQEKLAYAEKQVAVTNFLERVYHELRNLGVRPQDRAINFSATNALNVAGIFESALKDEMQLDTIEVEPSPLCRPGSECWDVKLVFFDPEKQMQRARKVHRFTVDVSDVCPVMVGKVRTWSVR